MDPVGFASDFTLPVTVQRPGRFASYDGSRARIKFIIELFAGHCRLHPITLLGVGKRVSFCWAKFWIVLNSDF